MKNTNIIAILISLILASVMLIAGMIAIIAPKKSEPGRVHAIGYCHCDYCIENNYTSK